MPQPPPSPKEIFARYLPEKAVDYCYGLWRTHDFSFKINKKRNSKLGDYRYQPLTKSHTITVNGDLNPYAFLITYLHETAHLLVRLRLQTRYSSVDPHGMEWKDAYKAVAQPMLNAEVFPPEILRAFTLYLKNPKASSVADTKLTVALDAFNHPGNEVFLSTLPEGASFTFNGTVYIKEQLARTRYLCRDSKTGRKYLISKIAKVIALASVV